MKLDARRIALLLAPAAVLAFWALAAFGFVAATMDAAPRQAFLQTLQPLTAPLVLIWLLISGALSWLLDRVWQRWIVAPARLAEQVRLLAATDSARELSSGADGALGRLADAVNQLARQRTQLKTDMAHQVQQATLAASREIEQERSRLAALMSELTQSVVVCNLDGRVLLYNNRARIQFRALSQAPSLADGAELIGLGRSIYAVFDRKLVTHALENIRQRMQRGAAMPSAQFVTTTPGGQLLRAQMAPVRSVSDAGAAGEINGFVLMLDNITRDFAEESQRDRLLQTLTEGSRASLGNLQAALEMLDFPDLDESTRERFLGVIRDESRLMSARLNELSSHGTQTQKTRWPLEDMLGADLLTAAQRRIEALYDCRVTATEVDAGLVAQGRQFFVAAGAGLPGRPIDRRVPGQVVAVASGAGRAARAAGSAVDRPCNEHRNGRGLGDRCDKGRQRQPAAQRARRGRAARG